MQLVWVEDAAGQKRIELNTLGYFFFFEDEDVTRCLKTCLGGGLIRRV